ncbi:MAG: SH3 domain-containing protein [Pseudomonadota bacterium]
MTAELAHPWGTTCRALCLCIAAALLQTASTNAWAQQSTPENADTQALYRDPADGGARRWQVESGAALDLRAAPSSDADALAAVPEGTVLNNLGCSMNDGAIWCEVRPFRGGARGFAPAERLAPAVGRGGAVPTGADDSRKRARKREFDVEGNIRCAQERGQSLDICAAAVARGVGGDATVVVTFPNGFKRQLFFVHGEFVAASATMSGVGRDTDWRVEDDTHFLRVDDQQFEISDEFVFGAGSG